MPATMPPALRAFDEPQLEALVELMFLAAFADGDFSNTEQRHFMSSVESLTDRRLPPGMLDELMGRLSTQLQRDGRAVRLTSVKARLVDPRSRKAALSLAIQVVAADGIIQPSERELVLDAADALEIDRKEVEGLFARLS
jgi:uncharacterized tellurite resistance protein B-like protein